MTRRVGVLTKFGEVKRHAYRLSKDEDSDVEWDDFASRRSFQQTATKMKKR